MDVAKSQVFIDEEKIKKKILALTPKEAREVGIRYRSTLKNMKDTIRLGRKINLTTKIIKQTNFFIIYFEFEL